MATRNSTMYDDVLRQDTQLLQTREQLTETEDGLLKLVASCSAENVDDAFLRSLRELQENITVIQRELVSAEKRRATLAALIQRFHMISTHAAWLHQTLTDLKLVCAISSERADC